MLIGREVDTGRVISRAFRLVGFVCCILVVASFAMFARDQMAGASQHQQNELVAGANPTAPSAGAGTHHAPPRRFIDGAAKILTKPFDAIIRSSNQWVRHGLPALFALIVYGFGLGYLARYSAART
jgi:hypothetical protein